jgi:hypothetical protein
MRLLAFFARHPRLRTELVCLAVVAVLVGGARLWTSVPPDAVRITIIHVDGADGTRLVTKTVTTDRTISNGAVAQRLQRDLAAMPLILDPFASFGCPLGSPYGSGFIYDTYTLT